MDTSSLFQACNNKETHDIIAEDNIFFLMKMFQLNSTKPATKNQLELLISLKNKYKIPVGNIWKLTMKQAYMQIMELYSFKLN